MTLTLLLIRLWLAVVVLRSGEVPEDRVMLCSQRMRNETTNQWWLGAQRLDGLRHRLHRVLFIAQCHPLCSASGPHSRP